MDDTTTIMSRCHEHDGEWIPEPGSKEYRARWDGWTKPEFTPEALVLFGQAAHAMSTTTTVGERAKAMTSIKKKKSKALKTHWRGSEFCLYAKRATDSIYVVDGYAFGLCAREERCNTCDHSFMNG